MTISDEQARLRRQLESRGIRDQRVLDAIESTRRDLFVPEELRHVAYDDSALNIGYSQTISQPYIVALMTEALALSGDEWVLEIGTGSGYQTAILAQLCEVVVTIERIAELAEPARELLGRLGYRNVEFRTGDGTLGCPERAPYEGILVTAAAPAIPAPLYEQLRMHGRLVVPVGDEEQQELLVVEKEEPKPRVSSLCGCRFVRLIGAAGWPAE